MSSIIVPPSRSYTNRALLIAALCNSKVRISNPLQSDDTEAMVDCLKTLGTKITDKKGYFEVVGDLLNIPDKAYKLNANLSGTTMRFVLALSAVIAGTKTLSGKPGLNKRPIGELVEALKSLGAKIEYLGKEGFPPVKISQGTLKSHVVTIKGTVASQFISALLIISPLLNGLTIKVKGEQVAKPYIDMTIEVMKHFGVSVINNNYKSYVVKLGQNYQGRDYKIEGDLSSAAYFLAMSALTKSKITLKNINPKTKQPDMEFIKILQKMGNRVKFGKEELTIEGSGLKPVNVDMKNCPDQIQTVAVLCSFVDGVSQIKGISNLRLKETDRIFAITAELKKMGVKAVASKDMLTIYGGEPKSARIQTYGDHRMAMSFAVAKSVLPDMVIEHPEVVSKTYPSFWKDMESMHVN